MKRFGTICSLALLLFSSLVGFSQSSSVFDQLLIVNNEWSKVSAEDFNFEDSPSFSNDTELIQLHLALVEDHLRSKDVSHLSALQRENRLNCLDYLHSYWQTGVFPQNLYHAERTPYFIDHKGTHCAVGQLIKDTGYGDFAAQIQSENNYAFISELSDKYAGIHEWANDYGFTLDELAWIQPGYPICDDACDELIFFEVVNTENYVGDFTYLWTNGDTNSFIADACPGSTYSVLVLDSLGTEVSEEDIFMSYMLFTEFTNTVMIPENTAPTFESSVTSDDSSCSGTAQLTITNEQIIHEVEWLNSASDSLYADGLCYGWQEFTIQSEEGCYVTDSVFIPSNIEINVIAISEDTLCQGDCFTVSYEIINSWENLESVSIELSRPNGSFSLFTVLGTDNELTGSIEVCLPDDLDYGNNYQIRVTSTDPISQSNVDPSIDLMVLGVTNMGSVDDNGFCNGSATLTTTYDEVISNVSWAPSNQTGFTASNLCSGWHYVTFDTDQGCSITDSVEVDLVLPEITFVSVSTDTICEGSCFQVMYTSVGLPQEAAFKAELSDETGSFDNPVLVSGINQFNSGTLNCCYLNNSPESSSYRIRVRTVDGDEFSEDNGEDITVNYVQYETFSDPGMLSALSEDPDSEFLWLQCPFASTVENGDTQFFTNGVAGSEYFVEVIQEGCTAYSYCLEFIGLDDSISEEDFIQLSLAPNPSDGSMVITSDSLIDFIEFYDLTGKLVWSASSVGSTQIQLDFPADMSNGIYSAVIYSDKGISSELIEISK